MDASIFCPGYQHFEYHRVELDSFGVNGLHTGTRWRNNAAPFLVKFASGPCNRHGVCIVTFLSSKDKAAVRPRGKFPFE